VDIERVIRILKALADRSRLLIAKSLYGKPQYLEELAERLNLAPSTVSFHLKKLEQAGLVSRRRQQYYAIFFLKNSELDLSIRELIMCDFDELDLQKERIAKYKTKVLKSFFRNGKLLRIPAQKQKRWIVFEQILVEFEFGRNYPEQELNEKIIKYHDDYCSIRRSLVEENVFSREEGIYRLTENYERFRKGLSSESTKHGLKESFEQSMRDKFGVQL